MRQMADTSAGRSPRAQIEPCPGQLPAHVSVRDENDSGPSILLDGERARLTWNSDGRELVRIVPLGDYIGLVIAVETDSEGEVARVTLRHDDRTLDVPLHEARYDHEINDLMRAWGIWADSLGVERLVEMADGALETVEQAAGRQSVRRRTAPRRVNRHFRTRRPNVMQGFVPDGALAGTEIIARR